MTEGWRAWKRCAMHNIHSFILDPMKTSFLCSLMVSCMFVFACVTTPVSPSENTSDTKIPSAYPDHFGNSDCEAAKSVKTKCFPNSHLSYVFILPIDVESSLQHRIL